MAEFRGRGFRIHWVQQGDGQPVVFAHGFVMDHTMWAPQFEDLPDDYRCIAWDMRGHGFSACPHGPWSMQDTVDDLVEFIEGVHAAPCHLVGLSIGGMQALHVALQRPDLVRSLVLVDTSASAEPNAELYRGFMDTIAAHGLSDDLIRDTLSFFYADRFIENDADGVAVHYKRAREMPREALVETLRALIERDSVADRLGEIRVPTLVVHGEQDRSIDPAQARLMCDGIAVAELVLVPECGHTTPLEDPDTVNAALSDFLARASR